MTKGTAGAIRIQRLGGVALSAAEAHGKRLDLKGKMRRIREAEALTTTGKDLNALYDHHIEGAQVHKSATKALHMIVQFPKELVDGNDGQWMLDHARAFAKGVFGDQAIFADRVDRDEKSMHVVDLFLAPKYEKQTKRKTTLAISTSKHLKELAARRNKPPTLRGQGQALQDEWFDYLRDLGLTVTRGVHKEQKASDWLSPEALAAKERLEALYAAQEAIEQELERSRAELDKTRSEAAKIARGAERQREKKLTLFNKSEIVQEEMAKQRAIIHTLEQEREAARAQIEEDLQKARQAHAYEREARDREVTAIQNYPGLKREHGLLKEEFERLKYTKSPEHQRLEEEHRTLRSEFARLRTKYKGLRSYLELVKTIFKNLFPVEYREVFKKVKPEWDAHPDNPDRPPEPPSPTPNRFMP